MTTPRPRQFDRLEALTGELTKTHANLESLAGRLRRVSLDDSRGAMTESEHRDVLMAATSLAQMASLVVGLRRDLDLVRTGTHRQVPISVQARYAVPERVGL